MNPTRSYFKHWLFIPVLLILTILVYWPGLAGPFLLDDFPQLGPLLDAVKLGNAGPDEKNYSLGRLFDEFFLSNSGPLGRPVAMTTFIMNAHYHGSDLWWWKFTNIIIHLLCGCILYFLTLNIIRWTNKDSNHEYHWLAAFVSAVWLLHPLNISTVLYTVQRMTQLATLFSLSGMLSYVVGRGFLAQSMSKGWLYIAAAFFLFFPLGIFSKETALLFPLFILLLEIFLFRIHPIRPYTVKQKRDFKLFVLGAFAIAMALFLVNFESVVLAGYASRDFSPYERVLTQFRVICLYLLEIVAPLQSLLGFYHDDVRVSTSLLSPITTLFSLLFIIFLLGFAWLMRRKMVIFSFGIFFFFIGHLLESTIFPLELMFEHRNYLPVVGVLIAIAGLLVTFIETVSLQMFFTTAVAGMVAVLTFFRADAWKSEETLYPYMYQAHPHSERLIIKFANNYAMNRNYRIAYRLLDKLEGLGPQLNRLYIQCLQKRQLSDNQLIQAKDYVGDLIDDYALTGFIQLAKTGIDEKCRFNDKLYLDIINVALKARFKNKVDHQKLAIYKAHYLYKQSQVNAAVETLLDVYMIDERNVTPLLLASHWLIEQGDYAQAREVLNRIERQARHGGKGVAHELAALKLKLNEATQIK